MQVNPAGKAAELAALCCTVSIGFLPFLIQPAFIEGLVQYLGLSESEAGYVAAAEMSGMALAALCALGALRHLSWKRCALYAFILVCATYLLCIWVRAPLPLALLRFFGGAGSGTLIALGYTALSRGPNPERRLGIAMAMITLTGALGLLMVPFGFAAVGLSGTMAACGLVSAAGLLVINRIPDKPDYPTSTRPALRLHGVQTLGVLSTILMFVGQGAAWAYVFLIGIRAGIGEQAVSVILTSGLLAGTLGAFTLAALGSRRPRSQLNLWTTVLTALSLIPLLNCRSYASFAIANLLFNFGTGMLTPLAVSILSDLDVSGRLSMLSAGVQLSGLALGPFLAAWIYPWVDSNGVIWLSIALISHFAWLSLPRRSFTAAESRY